MIPHCVPFIAPRQVEYVMDAMQRGELMRGAYIDRLEAEMSELCGGYAVAVSSGTAGLFSAFDLLGIDPGESLALPALTYIGPAQAIRLAGAIPLFVDVECKTWGAASWVDCAVHLYGAVSPSALVEDACEALGAWQLKGSIGIVSFNQNKIATGGGGGTVICRSEQDAIRLRHSVRGCRVDGPAHIWNGIGWPFEMSNLQAAVGCAQLEVLSETIKKKQAIAERYRRALPEIQWHESITYWQPCGLLPGSAASVVGACQSRGVDARHVWPCLPDLPIFAQKGEFPVARDIARRGISLPCSMELTREDQDTVIRMVRRAL